MAQGFDRYMLVVGAGNNRKFARLTDSERCAHFLGVLSLAARSPIRGYLLLTETEEAGVAEIAIESRVSAKVARSAFEKLKSVGVLVRDDEVGAWFVHDWDDVNPTPKVDNTVAERQRRYRERNRPVSSAVKDEVMGRDDDAGHADVTPVSRQRHAVTTVTVTPTSRRDNRDGHAECHATPLSPQTPLSPREGEEEEEAIAKAIENGRPRKRARVSGQVEQSKPPQGFPEDKLPTLAAVLPVLTAVYELRGGVEPQPRGVGLGIMRNVRADHLGVARQVEHWLTAGKGRRAKCADVAARFADWVADAPAASFAVIDGGVLERSPVLQRMDRWRHAPEYRRGESA